MTKINEFEQWLNDKGHLLPASPCERRIAELAQDYTDEKIREAIKAENIKWLKHIQESSLES